MTEPELRLFRDGDEHSVNRSFNEAFSLARPLEEWRWKFPIEPGRWIVVAILDDEVVAHYAAVPAWFQVGGKRLRGGQIVDAFCLRRGELVRRRVFEETVKTFYRLCGGPGKLDFLFGFPSERHLRLGRRRLLYGDPAPVPYWRRPAEPGRPRPSGYEVKVGFDPHAVDLLWQRSAHRYPVGAERDGDWLRRRFCGRPGVVYQHLGVWRDGRCCGWAVLRLDGDVGRWADLLWDGEEPGILGVLDHAAGELAADHQLDDVEMWLGGDEEAAAILAARGWRRQRHPQGLATTALSFCPGVDGSALASQLYLTLADTDLV